MKTVVTNTGDMGSYGHGMIQFKSFNGGPIYAYGHTGTAFGYGAMLCYIPSLDVYMCSAGNYMKIGQEFLQRDIYNFLVNNITSVIETNIDNTYNIFPNPASNILNISTTMPNFHITIMDNSGKIMLHKQNTQTLDISALPKGFYFLKLQDQNLLTIIIRKFVIE